jgi:hypothetical protein
VAVRRVAVRRAAGGGAGGARRAAMRRAAMRADGAERRAAVRRAPMRRVAVRRAPMRRVAVRRCRLHANGAPFGAPPPCHVKSELPSVHLFSAGQSVSSPASARLPRLVARGYTGLLP